MLDIEGAVEATWPDEGVAAHYGDPVREQRALAAGRVLVDRSNRGVVTVAGPDRLSWLHSLTSQALERLAPGDSAQALVLNVQGHIEHHLTLTDDGVTTWIHVEPGTAPALVEYLNSMRFMLRVEVADVTAEFAVVTVAGLTAAGPDGTALPAEADEAGVARMHGAFGYDVVVPRDRVAEVAGKLSPAIPVPALGGTTPLHPPAGLGLAGMWAYEAARIAARVPRVGVDTDHKTLPHEIGLIDTAVHLNKGCYRGQETVARIHNLGHPPRRLVFLHLDGSADRLPDHGAPVTTQDGTQVGFAGSSARHHEMGPVGLALVKRSVPVDAPLSADGVAAAQEVIVAPDAGANVKVAPRKEFFASPPAGRTML
jgi:folate-binding protein YgfZ